MTAYARHLPPTNAGQAPSIGESELLQFMCWLPQQETNPWGTSTAEIKYSFTRRSNIETTL